MGAPSINVPAIPAPKIPERQLDTTDELRLAELARQRGDLQRSRTSRESLRIEPDPGLVTPATTGLRIPS